MSRMSCLHIARSCQLQDIFSMVAISQGLHFHRSMWASLRRFITSFQPCQVPISARLKIGLSSEGGPSQGRAAIESVKFVPPPPAIVSISIWEVVNCNLAASLGVHFAGYLCISRLSFRVFNLSPLGQVEDHFPMKDHREEQKEGRRCSAFWCDCFYMRPLWECCFGIAEPPLGQILNPSQTFPAARYSSDDLRRCFADNFKSRSRRKVAMEKVEDVLPFAAAASNLFFGFKLSLARHLFEYVCLRRDFSLPNFRPLLLPADFLSNSAGVLRISSPM